MTCGIRAAQSAQISVRTSLAVSLLVNSLENGGSPPPVLPLRVRVLLLTSCTTGALTEAKSKVPDWGIKSTLAYGKGRLWHRVPYSDTMFFFGFGLCNLYGMPRAEITDGQDYIDLLK